MGELWTLRPGGVFRWDSAASSWTAVYEVEPGGPSLHAMWESAPDVLWVVGSTTDAPGAVPVYRRIEAGVGTSFEAPVTPPLWATWGAGPDDIWAVGNFGAMVHWDGRTWSSAWSGTLDGAAPDGVVDGTTAVRAIWAASSSDIWIVGGYDSDGVRTASGRYLTWHWNGARWVDVPTGPQPTPAGLLALWGSGPDDVWAVGEAMTILHWDGTTWTPTTLPTVDPALAESPLRAVWGSGPADVWAHGQVLLHFDGSVWSTVSTGWQGSVGSANSYGGAVTGSGPDDVWTFDSDWSTCSESPYRLTVVVSHWNGTDWRRVPLDSPIVPFGALALSPGDVWIVGLTMADYCADVGPGHAVHWDGTSWLPSAEPIDWATSLWGSRPDDIYAGGSDLSHWNGTSWSLQPSPVWLVAGDDPNDLWGLGQGLLRRKR
jgi:hypothetical protein